MPQQINLYHPLLLAPRRHLQAATLAQALGLWTLALLALAAWSGWRTQSMSSELAEARTRQGGERQQLAAAHAARLAALGSPAALNEELVRTQARLAERRHLLALLEGSDAAQSPTPLLQELAEELPAPVWLSEIRWAPGQVELAGQTLQPEALQAWISRRGTPSTLHVEQQQQQPGAGAGAAAARGPQGAWSFRLRQGVAASTAPAAPAVTSPIAPTASNAAIVPSLQAAQATPPPAAPIAQTAQAAQAAPPKGPP